MLRLTFAAICIASLSACASLDASPPKDIYDAWKKDGLSRDEIKNEMKLCGYKDVRLANDLKPAEIQTAEGCMKEKGFSLDLSSYRPNNCYGSNSPYLCNRFWGGAKPVLVPVRTQ